MSYNSYNQYSPYWQQTAGQATPQNASQNIGQSRAPYKPLSAYQSSQQPPQSSVSQPLETSGGASYGNQGYGNVAMNGAGNGRPQDFRASYTSTADRASLDGATALGNLAYASSLGRDGPMHQPVNYQRQQSNGNYGTGSSYGAQPAQPIQYRTGDERRDSNASSRGDPTRSQQATASPSFGYSANSAAYQGPGVSAGSNTQNQLQYSQPSRFSTEQHRMEYSQPSRPPSGQAVQQSDSRLGSQAAPSPTTSANQSIPSQAQGKKNSRNVFGKEQTRVHTPQSDKRPSSSHVSKGPTQEPQTPQGATNNSLTGSAGKKKAAVNISVKQTAKRNNEVLEPPAEHLRHDQASKPATPVEPQYTTVDPSQVFNHVEYSRRQAAAAAEAAAIKKAAEQAEAAKLAATQAKPATPVTPQRSETEPDLAKKDQMELEMKQMIEKMRDYKAKDPSLFTQIWEQVKKGQPPQRAPSQTLQGSATSPMVINGQLPSPHLIQSQLPPESELPAGEEFPPNFDRGRFPAQRRKRGGGVKAATSRKSSTPSGSTKPAAEHQRSPVPPEIAIPTPKVGEIFPDPGSQSMHQAIQQFHQNSKSPVAEAQQSQASAKQATANTLTCQPEVTTSTAPASQPVSAQSAPPSKPGGTYWPESKKKALAEAAQIALTSTPHDKAITITTQEIHDLLDQNPSYTQMCEILEYRGFVIDRGQFARVLLKAVPDLGSASTPTDASSSNTAVATRATPTNASPTGTGSNNTTITTKATSATQTMPTNASPTLTDSNHHTIISKAIQSTPTVGSFGKLIKETSKGPVAQSIKPQIPPYSVPPAPLLFHASNGYFTPYAPIPPNPGRTSDGNQNSGLPRDYRYVDPAYWTPDEQRHHVSVANQYPPNEPASHSYPTFSLHQQPGSIDGRFPDQNDITHQNEVIPHHASKQEMARKRTFGEIVDLTQIMSDDEELERYRPKIRNDNEYVSGPSKSVKNVFQQVAQRQQNIGRTMPKPFKYKYSGRDALLQSHDIIEPMNKRRDALRRSSYNPKTIARDVLLGLGKHPTMTPLNAHLDVLRDRFKAVDYDSNLSSFRWDLVDPEGEAKAELSDTDDQEPVPAVVAMTPQRPAPMAVMVDDNGGDVAAKGDQATSRSSDSKQKPSKRGPYKKRDVRSRIQPIGSAGPPQEQSQQSSPYAQDMSNVPNTNTSDLSRFAYSDPATAQTDFTPVNASSSTTPGSAPKRKGRPPGARNRQVRPDKGIPKKNKISSVGNTPSTAKAKPPDEEKLEKVSPMGKAPPVGNFSTGKPSTPTPTRPHITTITPSKQSGLRNSISAMSPTISVVIQPRSPNAVTVTPQASAKKSESKRTEAFSNDTRPSHNMYRCQWENCPAELHNLETLKKHVKKHRRVVDSVYPCLWADCSDSSNPISNNTQKEDGQHRRLKFKTDAEWVKHVEINHLKTESEIP